MEGKLTADVLLRYFLKVVEVFIVDGKHFGGIIKVDP